MTIQEQVTSLESSKKLKDLGFKQDSLFYWFPFDKGIHEWQVVSQLLSKETIKGWHHFRKTNKDFDFYSAFTASELGEMLPEKAKGSNKDGNWETMVSSKIEYGKTNKLWTVGYILKEYAHTNECEARAKMLIHLASNGLMEVKQFSGYSTETPKGDV